VSHLCREPESVPGAVPARYVLATANPDKAAEVREILAAALGDTVHLEPRPAGVPDVEETGATLEENALLKARAIADATGQAALADDTGLEVDALAGAPGVFAARYAGKDATYADNVAKLLQALSEVPVAERTARFRTVAAVAFPDGSNLVAEGVVDGLITLEPVGSGGFGYDPIFAPSGGAGLTFAEMSAEAKHEISHRGRAIRALARLLAGQAPVGPGPSSGGPAAGSAPGAPPAGADLNAGAGEMAIGALVLSVLWIFFLGSVVGLVLGLVARRRTSRDRQSTVGRLPIRRIADIAVLLGGLGVAIALVAVVGQLAGVFHIGAICRPAVTGVLCRLHLTR
jgi:XTP/dITP diphosphohydrolase